MKRLFVHAVALAAGLACTAQAAAADLLQVYALAKQNDSQFAASRAQLEAGLERLPQGRALLLPTLSADGNAGWTDARNRTNDVQGDWDTYGWSVTLTQPLFRWQNLVQYRQSQYQVQQAEAVF